MLFGALDIHLLAPCEAHRDVAAAMGSLGVRVDDAEFGTVVFPFCSALRVSPRHILTAAHCARSDLIFDPKHVASPTDVSSFRVVTVGSIVRLFFEGETISTPRWQSSLPRLGEPAYIDQELDFAVFSLPASSQAAFIDLSAAESAGERELSLYGYPNGMPLARASHCHATPSPRLGFLTHDCDSMKGSSGGLLVATEGGAPIAMHLRAEGMNEASYYQKTGQFEAFGVACEEGSASNSTCTEAPLYNEAVELSSVARRIEERAPAVWREIKRVSAGTCSSFTLFRVGIATGS